MNVQEWRLLQCESFVIICPKILIISSILSSTFSTKDSKKEQQSKISLRLALLSVKQPRESDTQVAAEAVQYLITHAKRLFGIRNLDKLSDLYEDQGDLGMGTYAVVKKIKHIETGTCYAAKIIQKQHLSEKELGRLAMETNILKRIRHPNVIALKAICETENELFLIMELAHGGSLIDHVKKNAGSYSEDTVINITRQILDTLVFLHDLHIVHRDIKPENILLRRKGTLELKMADFGLSKMFDATIKMATMCGSPAYVAPEVFTFLSFLLLFLLLFLMKSGKKLPKNSISPPFSFFFFPFLCHLAHTFSRCSQVSCTEKKSICGAWVF